MKILLSLTFSFIILLSVFISNASQSPQRMEALKNLEQRAMEGDAKALYNLATLYDSGYDSIPVDSMKSTALYILSAQKGYAPAQSFLGYRYFNGEAIRQDIDSAFFWMIEAARQGDFRAANNIGYLLANSDKVKRDYTQAIYWLSKAADAGLPSANASLGDLFRQGLGTEPDTLAAISLYNKAIEGGLADASLKLLNMMGPSWENLQADSALSLGRYYYLHGAPNIGVVLFKNADKQGLSQATALLGDAYSRALGINYDYDKSLSYFLRAALEEDPSAAFVIGELLELFPDALETETSKDILEKNYSSGNIPAEINNPEYWYNIAAQKGVSTAEEASDLLLYGTLNKNY